MKKAACLPWPMALTIMDGPVTASPPAKTEGSDVSSVIASTRIVSSEFSSNSRRKGEVVGRSPMDRMARSTGTSCSLPATGIGRLLPLESGSPIPSTGSPLRQGVR